MKYFAKAYFVYDENSKHLIELIESNEFGTKIISVHIDDFVDEKATCNETTHIVVSISQDKIPAFLANTRRCNASIGIVPLPTQKEQIKNLYTISDLKTNIEIALRDDVKGIDLVKINDQLVYSQGIIGMAPLVGENLKKVRLSFLGTLVYSLKKFLSIKLQKFEIITHNGQKITTAASAIVILNHTKQGLISKIFDFNQSMRDGKITLVIISPYSVGEYIKLLASIIIPSKNRKSLPKSIGYIQSKSFKINASTSKKVVFDNAQSMNLPIECMIAPEAIRLNASDEFWLKNEKVTSTKETIKVSNLPDSIESGKYTSQGIPLFKSVSEERFKELFQILRNDAKTTSTYIVLMVLSTLLASFGLYANSAAVIIGAMLVAPLMSPIVSIAMGLLRADSTIIKNSLVKIVLGVIMALTASSLFAYLLPTVELTQEMHNRINPTLLDLGIAILSGIAAAYSKSFKEISQNLAGVAIAVALVPPLSVAGIGLGYGDIYSFLGAFLLFFTNLVGIIIAAVVTFYVLGFSSIVKSKKSVVFVFALMMAVSFPLFFSYEKMIEKYKISHMLKEHRFLVNNKYIIVDSVGVSFKGDMKVLNLDLAVREALNRDDFEELQQDMQRLLNSKLFIKTKVEYIL